jgi:hypothetical protein
MKRRLLILGLLTLAAVTLWCLRGASDTEFNDAHLHLTNYIQEGTDIRTFLTLMGTRVHRVALFGIPLQQQWSYRVDGDRAPTYYLQSDAPLYYYSFTDASIAMAYRSLPPNLQERFDPMITGFNPTDMYATDHVRRVLQTFPEVFSGIGEFTIHKEFVSSKIAGPVASLIDPALDRLFDFAAEVGLVAIIHNDIDVPFPKPGAKPAYLEQMTALLKRHRDTVTIWAHTGVGRVVRPIQAHAASLENLLQSPDLPNLYFDISWDEMAKYVVESPEATKTVAALIERYPDRFLFGTDEVAPTSESGYTKVFEIYRPLWTSLSTRASEKVRIGNYERIFNAARRRVRAWEKDHVNRKTN